MFSLKQLVVVFDIRSHQPQQTAAGANKIDAIFSLCNVTCLFLSVLNFQVFGYKGVEILPHIKFSIFRCFMLHFFSHSNLNVFSKCR